MRRNVFWARKEKNFMISGFKTEQLFKIVKESLEYDYKKWKEENPTKLAGQLNVEEKSFYSSTV